MTGLEGTAIGEKIKEVLSMAGPAFGVGSNIQLNLNFKDMEEIKAHPMASQMLVNMDQLLTTLLGKDKATVLAHKPDFSSVSKEDLDKHYENSKYASEKKHVIDFIDFATEMLEDFDPICKVNLQSCLYNVGSTEVTIKGTGYAELVSLIVKAATVGLRDDYAERIISDFKSGQEGGEGGDEEKKPEEDLPETKSA